MLLIACPSSRATESTTILLHAALAVDCGIVLVTIILSIGDFSIRSIAGPDSTPCTAQASTRAAPLLFSARRRLRDRAGRVDDVVLDDAGAALDVADHVHHFRRPIVAAPLVDDRQLGVEPLGVGARALGAAGVGRDHRQVRASRAAPGSR